MTSGIRYRPEIDGLRAIAVLAVLVFHLNANWLRGGFLGVDIFFVISGYLISSIVFRECDSGRFSFADFWRRRIRRILPVVCVTVLATVVASQTLLYPDDAEDAAWKGLAAIGSFANMAYWWDAGDYWGAAAENSPLLHTWSLSLEEQFYLAFPAILVPLYRARRTAATVALTSLVFVSAITFAFYSYRYLESAFYLLPCRAWELGLGCLLATVRTSSTAPGLGRFANHISSLGVAMIALAVFCGGPSSNRFLAGAAASTLGAVLILVGTDSGSGVVKSALEWGPARWIGRLSYSMYMWHWPTFLLVDAWSRGRHSETMIVVLKVAITVALSIASFRMLEAPLRRSPRGVSWAGGLFILAVLGCWLLARVPERDYTEYQSRTVNGPAYSSAPKPLVRDGLSRFQGLKILPRDSRWKIAYREEGVLLQHGSGDPQIVLLGDSHGTCWAYIVDKIAESLQVSASIYAIEGDDCGFPIPIERRESGDPDFPSDQVWEYDQARFRSLSLWRPPVVLLSNRWDQVQRESLVPLLGFLQSIGSQVLLIEQPPILYFGDRSAMMCLAHDGVKPDGDTRKYVAAANSVEYEGGREMLRSIAAKFANCELVPTHDVYSYGDQVLALDGASLVYFDDDHLTSYGASLCRQRIRDAIEAAMRRAE
ncbi:O-acetyltransferase OatA [Botrimarina colliarenosi]|uniref:O-acetyltransferase OatA n=2 Tax=Botrimarina colliarenosi TaxID=2528001 RepID=A0A5C5ZZ85_9BACT|nr:O-acetyltransferase OatA [Botrimarina colliarenosi]